MNRLGGDMGGSICGDRSRRLVAVAGGVGVGSICGAVRCWKRRLVAVARVLRVAVGVAVGGGGVAPIDGLIDVGGAVRCSVLVALCAVMLRLCRCYAVLLVVALCAVMLRLCRCYAVLLGDRRSIFDRRP
jgi:hypothetical protein